MKNSWFQIFSQTTTTVNTKGPIFLITQPWVQYKFFTELKLFLWLAKFEIVYFNLYLLDGKSFLTHNFPILQTAVTKANYLYKEIIHWSS